MKVSPRTKFWLVTMFFFVGLFFVKPGWIGLNDTYEDSVFFGWIIAGSIAISMVRCPNCGTPLIFQGKIGGIPLIIAFANKRCKKCDHDLTSID
ncbi:MAG: hypothetical protein Q7R66_14855 [Undibacterium sp.]|uniref:hypothetical protein n=1 Tax=Undibacterium sp. TaxID=1914977 RepID=UPI0027234637|nr:hypothetical protein [Undibacterium sp.]MDO8653464.1 hypothetical protein [Undibacterium sp.]